MWSVTANGSNCLGGCILSQELPGILIHHTGTDKDTKHSILVSLYFINGRFIVFPLCQRLEQPSVIFPSEKLIIFWI